MNLDGAISKLTSFGKKQFISYDELTDYTNAFIKDNNITNIDLCMNVNYALGNGPYAAYHCEDNRIDFNISEIIIDYMEDVLGIKYKRKFFKPIDDPNKLISKYNLTDEEVLLCNLKIMQNLNHELFHISAFFGILNYANGADYFFDPEILHNIAKSSMNQALDSTIDKPLYRAKHDVFYEEFLAITHSYKWTYEMIEKLGLDTSCIRLFNQDTFKRISNVFKELNNHDEIYLNKDFNYAGCLNTVPDNLAELNYNYGTNFISICTDLGNYSPRRQSKILKEINKKEDYYLKGLDKFSIMIYMLNKQVYENTKKASSTYTEYETLLYGLADKNSKVADIFNGDLDGEVLDTNMFSYFNNNMKTKTY